MGKEARATVTVRQRPLEGVVGKPVGVQIPPSAASEYTKGIRNNTWFALFLKVDANPYAIPSQAGIIT
jgi:hypothetical protein